VHGEKDLLGRLHRLGARGRSFLAALVGADRDYSDRLRELVDCLSEQLVLGQRAPNSPGFSLLQFIGGATIHPANILTNFSH
jgi:hypothetical protein